MSLYTNSTTVTHIIDPVYNRSNQRSVFHIPNDTSFSSNIRLGGFGAIANTASTYLQGVGALGVIDSIQLQTQDGTVIDQIQNFQLYNSFKQYNTPNQKSKDNTSNYSKNHQGSYFGGITLKDVGGGELGQKINNFSIDADSKAVNTAENTTALGWISLHDCLNIFRVMPVINTGILKNLRLIVNYNNSLTDYIIDTANVPFTTAQPYMIIDEVKGAMFPLQTVEFNSIEHDSINVPAVVPTATEITKVQNINAVLNGFRNKSVQRLLVCKSPQLLSTYQTTGVNMPFGKVASVACHKETFQLSLNGNSLWTEGGITKENQRLAVLNDAFSDCSTYPFLNGTPYIESDTLDRNLNIDIGNDVISQLDFYGCFIQSEISDLKLFWSRTGIFVENAGSNDITDTASVNQALTLNCFAEVLKVLSPTADGGFTVQYA